MELRDQALDLRLKPCVIDGGEPDVCCWVRAHDAVDRRNVDADRATDRRPEVQVVAGAYLVELGAHRGVQKLDPGVAGGEGAAGALAKGAAREARRRDCRNVVRTLEQRRGENRGHSVRTVERPTPHVHVERDDVDPDRAGLSGARVRADAVVRIGATVRGVDTLAGPAPNGSSPGGRRLLVESRRWRLPGRAVAGSL